MQELFVRIGSHLVEHVLLDPVFILAMMTSFAAVGMLIHVAVQSSGGVKRHAFSKAETQVAPSDSYPDLDLPSD